MDTQFLSSEAKKLVAKPKGILAADESSPTCDKRFEALGIATTEENRRKYRELLISCPSIEDYISGFILFDETIRQSTGSGVKFTDVFKQKGMSIGIKVDQGVKDLPNHEGEKITVGLDGLKERLQEYKSMGATFTKWRAVITIDKEKGLPSTDCLESNANTLVDYALVVQEQNMVPILEPEVILEGSHTIEDSFDVTSRTIATLFKVLKDKGAYIPGLILKTSMVISGSKCQIQATTEQVAELTLKCLKENVPSDIGGIVFLSGGQTEQQATDNLRAMHTKGELPWPLTFSYSRAIQAPVLKAWASNMEDVAGAQAHLIEMARNNANANLGK